MAHDIDDDRLQEMHDYFFHRISQILHDSPYMELVEPLDTAAFIRAALQHVALAAIVGQFHGTRYESQVHDVAGAMATDLFDTLNTLLIDVRRFPTSKYNTIERN